MITQKVSFTLKTTAKKNERISLNIDSLTNRISRWWTSRCLAFSTRRQCAPVHQILFLLLNYTMRYIDFLTSIIYLLPAGNAATDSRRPLPNTV